MSPDAFLFDPLAVAYGHAQGVSLGVTQGEADGYKQGYVAGWEASTAEGNRRLVQCAEYIQKHVRDKQTMAAEIELHRQSIDELSEAIKRYQVKIATLSQLCYAYELRFGHL